MGCGGIADIRSGLPPDKLGEDLTATELEQLCGAARAFAEEHPVEETARCRMIGLAATGGAETAEYEKLVCQDHYDRCTPSSEPVRTFCDGAAPGEDILSLCKSTVQEIESCLSIRVARTVELANELRYCDEIDLDYVAEVAYVIFPEMRTPEGCESVRQNCWQVLD